MIKVKFYRKYDRYSGVVVSGHADYGDYGQDIVCAAVTSVVQYVANALTEVLKLVCEVEAKPEKIEILLGENGNGISDNFLEALKIHLTILSEDYPNTIDIKCEV